MKEAKDFLIEVGVEELPAGFINPAIKFISGCFREKLKENRLSFDEIKEYSTPRRLTLHIIGIPLQQEDVLVEKVGPAKRIAYTDSGELSKAGEGFIRGAQAGNEDIFIKSTDKGEYIAVRKLVKGEESSKILTDISEESLKKISFPKSMFWSSKQTRFARPVRWITALFGNDIVSIGYNGLRSGRITFGNVFEKKGETLTVASTDDYLVLLEKDGFVIADRTKRKSVIDSQLRKIIDTEAAIARDNGNLLEEVTDLVEYPTAILAQFAEKYLQLPDRIIQATLVKNQKYFPLNKEDGTLSNKFIFVANNHPDYADNTRVGNEKVVKARLDDAVFYYREDSSKNIDYFNEKLKDVVFEASLGSIKDKTERVAKISGLIAEMLFLDKSEQHRVHRLAEICKFDLATLMVGEKEFAGLQGYIGKCYAQLWGEEEEVAKGIEEHYLPFGLNEKLPETISGTIVSIADKIDTLCGIFGIGIVPTGSNDPFALRRAANGIVRTICEKNLEIKLFGLVTYTYNLLNPKLKENDRGLKQLWSFFKQRVDWYLQQKGIDYDVSRAILEVDLDDLSRVFRKAEALQRTKQQQEFQDLLISYRRVSNIISKEKDFQPLQEKLFVEQVEKDLDQGVEIAKGLVNELLSKNKYEEIILRLIELKSRIDSFFDKVLVNTEDRKIRANRYALLNKIRELFLHIGDLSLIVLENEKDK